MWELGTIKKVECWRIKAFELWCWRSLLRVPWTARRSNQSILKKWVFVARTDCWTWSSNTLVTWCKELTHQKRPWCWERLKAGGDDRGWDGWMASPIWWTWVWVSSRSWWWTGRPGVLQSMGSQRGGHYWATELNWKTRNLRARENPASFCSLPHDGSPWKLGMNQRVWAPSDDMPPSDSARRGAPCPVKGPPWLRV